MTGRRGKFSAGVVIVRDADRSPRYLILRAYRNWDFPKGGVEAGETPLQAARREVEEEADVRQLHFRWGRRYRETAPYSRGKVARYYLAETSQRRVRLPVNPELGRPENHEFRWVDLAQARALLPPRLQPILAWAAESIGDSAR